MNQHSLVYVFISFRSSLPRFLPRINNFCRVSCASSPLLRALRSYPLPAVRGLWSSAGCDGLAGAWDLAALIASYSLTSPSRSRLPTHPYYPRALSLVHPPLCSLPGSRFCSRPHPCPRARSCLGSGSHPHPSPWCLVLPSVPYRRIGA